MSLAFKFGLGVLYFFLVVLAWQGFLIAHRVDVFVKFWNAVLAKLGASTRLTEEDFRDPSFRTFGDTAVLFAAVMAALPFFALNK